MFLLKIKQSNIVEYTIDNEPLYDRYPTRPFYKAVLKQLIRKDIDNQKVPSTAIIEDIDESGLSQTYDKTLDDILVSGSILVTFVTYEYYLF